MLIDSFLDDCELANLSPRTIEFYRERLGRYRWWCEQEGVPLDPERQTPAHLRSFLRYLQSDVRWDGEHTSSVRKMSAATLDGYYRTVRRFYNWLTEQELIERNPLAKVQRPKVPEQQPDPFTPGDVAALFAAIEERGGRFMLRDGAILAMLLDVGLRVTELADLDVEHVNINTGELVVMSGKGRKSRPLALGATARRRLRLYYMRDRRHDGPGPLFLTRDGKRMSRNSIRLMLDRLGDMTGIQPVNPHRMRHTAAVNAVRAGMDAFHLQMMLGHTSLEMTRRYVKLANADMTEAAKRHSPLDYMDRG